MTGSLELKTTHRIEPDDDAIADARRFDMSEAEIEALKVKLHGPPTGLAVWPENAAAVEAFLTAASQWRTAIAVVEGQLRTLFVGLDYAGAKVALDARRIETTPELWNGLVEMEQAALAALNGPSTGSGF